jgi:carbon-monoxide dehydrogenase medium subunit
MYPAQFDYVRANSVDEAIRLLGEHEDSKLIAGGHSLIPMMKLRLAQPATVIDIGSIAQLKGISVSGGRVRIGALTRHADIARSEDLHRHCPILAEAAAEIGDAQVRNRGTIGGNIAHADPGSDLPAVLRCLGSEIHLQGKSGSRTVTAADFFVDLLTTDLGEGELVTSIETDALGAGTGSCYLKFEHPASGYAVVGAAAVVTLEGGKCTGGGLAFNGVTAIPLDGGGVIEELRGTDLSDAAIEAACAKIEAIDPMGDIYASGEYRVHLARVYGKRALKKARDRARA